MNLLLPRSAVKSLAAGGWWRKPVSPGLLWIVSGLLLFPGRLLAQSHAKVDFANDVQPLLRENCFDCHGPMKQKAGMRLAGAWPRCSWVGYRFPIRPTSVE